MFPLIPGPGLNTQPFMMGYALTNRSLYSGDLPREIIAAMEESNHRRYTDNDWRTIEQEQGR